MKIFKNVSLVIIVAFNLRWGITSVSPVVDYLKLQLSLSNFQVSLLTSIPVFCMGIFAFFVGLLQTKYGRKRSIFYLLLLMFIAAATRLGSHSFISLCLSAFIIGLTIAIIGPMLSGFIKEQFPHHQGSMVGVYSLSMGVGATVASGAALSLSHRYSWQVGLGIWSVIALISALVWQLGAADDKKAPKLTSQTSSPLKVSELLQTKQMWALILYFGFQSGIYYSAVAWTTSFFSSRNLPAAKNTLYLTVMMVLITACSFIIPSLMDRFGSTKNWNIFCTVAALFSGLTFWLGSNDWAYLLAILLFAIGSGGLFPISLLLPLQFSTQADEASLKTGLMQAGGYIMAGIIPLALGSLMDWTGNYLYLPLNYVLSSVIMLVIGNLLLSEK